MVVAPNSIIVDSLTTIIGVHTSCKKVVGTKKLDVLKDYNVLVMTHKTFNEAYDFLNGQYDLLLIDEVHKG